MSLDLNAGGHTFQPPVSAYKACYEVCVWGVCGCVHVCVCVCVCGWVWGVLYVSVKCCVDVHV